MSAGSEKLEKVKAALQEEFELGAQKKENLGYYTCTILPKEFSESAGINPSQVPRVLEVLRNEEFIKGFKISPVYNTAGTQLIENEIAIEIFFPLNFLKDQQPILSVNQAPNGDIVLHYDGKKYKLADPDTGEVSDRFFEYIFENAEKKLKVSDIKVLGSKKPNKAAEALGFNGVWRKLFFPLGAGSTEIVFKKAVFKKDLELLGVTEKEIKTEVTKLKEL